MSHTIAPQGKDNYFPHYVTLSTVVYYLHCSKHCGKLKCVLEFLPEKSIQWNSIQNNLIRTCAVKTTTNNKYVPFFFCATKDATLLSSATGTNENIGDTSLEANICGTVWLFRWQKMRRSTSMTSVLVLTALHLYSSIYCCTKSDSQDYVLVYDQPLGIEIEFHDQYH